MTCDIAVMGKVPRPGRSKTRLAKSIGAEAAAALSGAFLRDTTENIAAAARSAAIRGLVAYMPAGEESLLDPYLAAGTGLLLADGSTAMPDGIEGFGRSLYHAVQALLGSGSEVACVLNADGPNLPTDYLVQAATILAAPGDRAVLGPAEDGGYYLLGLKRPHPELFMGVPWSTAGVRDATLAAAEAIGLEVVELPPWYDVDDAQSLRRLIDDLDRPELHGFPSPATRARLGALGLSGASAECQAV